MKSDSRNISHSMCVTNIYGFHDMALSNQIQNQLLWEALHPALNIFFTVPHAQRLIDGADVQSQEVLRAEAEQMEHPSSVLHFVNTSSYI